MPRCQMGMPEAGISNTPRWRSPPDTSLDTSPEGLAAQIGGPAALPGGDASCLGGREAVMGNIHPLLHRTPGSPVRDHP